MLCFERLKSWHVKLDTDYAYLACGRILINDRKVVYSRRQRNVQMSAHGECGIGPVVHSNIRS